MKQTAVEWLEENLIGYEHIPFELIEQAKEMEKEQICISYIYGSAYGIDVANNLTPNEYYNQTFKNK